MWKVILFAHDFSDCAARSEAMVRDLARTFCARVVLCHVSQVTHGLPPSTLIRAPGEEGMVKAGDYVLKMATEMLRTIARRLEADCVAVETAARLDENIADGILAAATAHGAEVIVMGTHGRVGLEHFLLGSIAEKVLRRAEVPVITLRSPGGHANEPGQPVLDDESAG